MLNCPEGAPYPSFVRAFVKFLALIANAVLQYVPRLFICLNCRTNAWRYVRRLGALWASGGAEPEVRFFALAPLVDGVC